MSRGSWASITALVAATLLYYGVVVRAIGEPVARWANDRATGHRLARRFTAAQLDGSLRLLIAGVLQACFVALAIAATPISLQAFVLDAELARVLPVAVVLGIAEVGLGSQLAFVTTRVADLITAPPGPHSVESWLVAARGGWIRYYARTAEAVPGPVLVGLTLLYVGGEEVLFRGVVLELGKGLPSAWLVAVATALFVACQSFSTPSWRTALFPMAGAAVVGLTHCVLYLEYPVLAPLVVAHACMFLASVH